MKKIIATEGKLLSNGVNYAKRVCVADDDNSWFEVDEQSYVDPAIVREYEKLVEAYIAEKYSTTRELAMQRQRDTKAEEWQIYYDFCEECKVRARCAIRDKYPNVNF